MSEPLFRFTVDTINVFEVYPEKVILTTGRMRGTSWFWKWDGKTILTSLVEGKENALFTEMVPYYLSYINKMITEESDGQEERLRALQGQAHG